MKNIEERLKKEKVLFDSLELPIDLEDRLHEALKGKQQKPVKESFIKRLIAAAAIILFLFGYNYDAIAHYSKKILGFDTIISGTLKDLNDLGKGQIINKSYTFKNGAQFTLDGIMFDENRLILFYTFNSENVNNFLSQLTLKGLFNTYNISGGYGKISDDGKEIKGVFDFAPPKAYERSLTLKIPFQNNHQMEEGEISFKIDRSKAMGFSIKENLNKTIEVDNSHIKFKTITASPTQTVIDGSIDLRFDQLTDRGFDPALELELLVNGKSMAIQGASMSSSLRGYDFSFNFDRLPEGFSTIEIKIKRAPTSKKVDITVPINGNEKNNTFEIEKQSVTIKEISFDNQYTYVTLLSECHVYLPELFLLVGKEKLSFESTTNAQLQKTPEGQILRERTVVFENQNREFDLLIKRIYYLKSFDEVVKIY